MNVNSWRAQPLRLLYVVALATVIAALILSWRTWRQVGNVELQLRTRRGEIKLLQQMELELQPYYAAEQALAARPVDSPSPSDFLAQTLPTLKPDDVHSTDVDLGDGWLLKRERVVLPEGDLSAVMALLPQIESAPLFWRVVRVDIHAATAPAGHGQAALEFETVISPR